MLNGLPESRTPAVPNRRFEESERLLLEEWVMAFVENIFKGTPERAALERKARTQYENNGCC